MARKHSPTQNLAYRFVTEVMEAPWNYKSGLCRIALRHAKLHLSQQTDPVTGDVLPGFDLERTIKALLMYKQYLEENPSTDQEGKQRRVTFIGQALWLKFGTNKSWYELTQEPDEDAPPIYDPPALKRWLARNGDRITEEQKAEIEKILAQS